MADANRIAFRYAKETAWGETPDGSATLIEVPLNSDTLALEKVTAQRATLKSTRMSAKSRHVGTKVAGDSVHELTQGDFKTLLGGAIADDAPVTTSITSETCTTSASGQTITADSGTPFSTLATTQPSFIRVAGGAQSGTNGVKRVLSITSTVITLAAGSITTDETSVSLDLTMTTYQSGTDFVSFLIEREYSDTTHKFWYNGCVIGGVSLNIEAQSIIEMTLSWMGKDHAVGLAGVSGYLVNDASHAAGASTLTVDTGTRDLKKGQKFTVAGDATVYTLTADSGASATSLAFTPAGVEALADDAVITLAPDPLATVGDGSPTADSGDDAMNSSSDVHSFFLDDTATDECFSSMTIEIDNGHREKPCIGALTSSQFGQNGFKVTGSFTMHFTDLTEYDEFLTHAAKKLVFGLEDPAGNFVGFTIHAITYDESPGPVPTGEDTDILVTFNFSSHEPGSSEPSRIMTIDFSDAV